MLPTQRENNPLIICVHTTYYAFYSLLCESCEQENWEYIVIYVHTYGNRQCKMEKNCQAKDARLKTAINN